MISINGWFEFLFDDYKGEKMDHLLFFFLWDLARRIWLILLSLFRLRLWITYKTFTLTRICFNPMAKYFYLRSSRPNAAHRMWHYLERTFVPWGKCWLCYWRSDCWLCFYSILYKHYHQARISTNIELLAIEFAFKCHLCHLPTVIPDRGAIL